MKGDGGGDPAGMIADDVRQGLVPAIVVATMGTTSSTACDPLRPIGEHQNGPLVP